MLRRRVAAERRVTDRLVGTANTAAATKADNSTKMCCIYIHTICVYRYSDIRVYITQVLVNISFYN